MKKYTITAITEWYEDKALIDGDCSHEPKEDVMELLKQEHELKEGFLSAYDGSDYEDQEWAKALPFTCTAENLDDALDQYNQKFCQYDYLKACDAEGEVSDQVDEAVEDLNAGASYDEIQNEVEDLPLEQFCQQLDFLVKSDDPKARELYNTFRRGWKREFRNINVSQAFVNIRELHPTQNVIFAHKSLDLILNGKWRMPGVQFAVDKLLGEEKPKVEMGDPIVVCNVGGVDYLIDGHHRWSKAYAFNPSCSMKAYIINEAFADADEVLKFAQGTLTILRNKSPINDAQPSNDINLYDITPRQLSDLVNASLSREVLAHIANASVTAGIVDDPSTLVSYLWSNVRILRQYAPRGSHDREFMPQFPDGDTNPANAVAKIKENKKMKIKESQKFTLTIGQLKRLVKESMEYPEVADKLDQVKRCLIRAAWDDSFNYDGDEADRSVEDFYTIRIVEKGTRLPDYIKGIEKAFETHDWVYVIEGEKAERGSGETSLSFFAADDALKQNYKVLEHGWEDRMTMYWVMVDKTDIDESMLVKESDEVKLQMVALKKAYDEIKRGKRVAEAGNWKIEALGKWNDDLGLLEHGAHWVYFKGAAILEVNYETMQYGYLMETPILSKDMVDAILDTLECKDFDLDGDEPDFLDEK